MDLKKDERFCPHCSQILKRRTFYDHRRQFFDEHSNVWTKRAKRSHGGEDISASDPDEPVQLPLLSTSSACHDTTNTAEAS